MQPGRAAQLVRIETFFASRARARRVEGTAREKFWIRIFKDATESFKSDTTFWRARIFVKREDGVNVTGIFANPNLPKVCG